MDVTNILLNFMLFSNNISVCMRTGFCMTFNLTPFKILPSVNTLALPCLRYLNMQFKLVFYFLLLSFVAISCNKIDDPQFTLPMEIAFDIPGNLNTIETHYFLLPNTPTFLNLSLNGNGYSEEDITSVKSQNARFSEINETVNLDFINSIVINAYTDDDEIELFYLENIQFGTKEDIQLLASIPELKEFMAQEFVNLEVGIRFRQFPPSNFRAKVDFAFSFYAE